MIVQGLVTVGEVIVWRAVVCRVLPEIDMFDLIHRIDIPLVVNLALSGSDEFTGVYDSVSVDLLFTITPPRMKSLPF